MQTTRSVFTRENFKKFVILAREIFELLVFREALRSGSGALGLLNGTFSENARLWFAEDWRLTERWQLMSRPSFGQIRAIMALNDSCFICSWLWKTFQFFYLGVNSDVNNFPCFPNYLRWKFFSIIKKKWSLIFFEPLLDPQRLVDCRQSDFRNFSTNRTISLNENKRGEFYLPINQSYNNYNEIS